MKNNYIINKEFYIKDDLSAVLVYFDYFSQGLSVLNKYTDSTFIRKSLNTLLRGLIVLAYLSKIYKLLCKTVSYNDDAIIIIKRKGHWANTLRLVNKNGKLKVLKQSFSNNFYEREKAFYQTYKNNSSKLKLLNHRFLSKNTIEIDFFKSKTLQRLINEGSINFEQALEHVNKIKKELKVLYKDNTALVHGDLWLTNIFISRDCYYLIDYTDSHVETLEYDLYVLLISLLSSFRRFGTNRAYFDFYLKKRSFISKLLEIDIDNVLKIEERYKKFRTLKMFGDNENKNTFTNIKFKFA